uniref:Putative CP n=1 Tax=Alloteropsis cryptic virus 2 TaxID=2809262 RepID=A0A890CAU9_9VIRU|nr:putative CP [Alloteropsis cryptic virus 2]
MATERTATGDPSTGSSPPPRRPDASTGQPSRARVGTIFQMRSELPAAPTDMALHLKTPAVDDKSAGNFNYTAALLERDQIGFWRDREDCAAKVTSIELKPIGYYHGIRSTLEASLCRLLKLKTELEKSTFEDRVTRTAQTLATGCCVMTYLKLRLITLSENFDAWESSTIRRPRVSDDLAIPAGFAFAIQQLGYVNVLDTPKEVIYAPRFPKEGHQFGLPTEPGYPPWNPNAYAEAVEYARALGMQFATVDLKKKEGTAWWLYRQSYEEGIFELHCPIPETNFTNSMTATHALWLDDKNADPSRTFVDLSPLGKDVFAIAMRNPHPGINITCFEAISGEAPEVVANV